MINHLIGVRVPAKLLARLEREQKRRKLGSIQAALIVIASEALRIEPEIPRGSGPKREATSG